MKYQLKDGRIVGVNACSYYSLTTFQIYWDCETDDYRTQGVDIERHRGGNYTFNEFWTDEDLSKERFWGADSGHWEACEEDARFFIDLYEKHLEA